MHTHIVLLALLTAFAASCKSVDCGDGTLERDGVCVPSNQTVGTAQCGPGTRLDGTQCTPLFPPTQCDPDTTEEDMDSMGVVTCIGTGAGGCSARLACPAPSDATKQTICGRIYDFANNQPFATAGATGEMCSTATTTGPCSLAIKAYEAATFAGSNGAAGQLPTGEVYIDDCGRFRVSDITMPATPLIALGVDDVDATKAGPAGTTNAAGVATAKGVATTRDVELFVVSGATLAGWGPNTANGPLFDATNGIFAPIYRGHRTGTDLASGVTVTRNGATDAAHDYYFTDIATRTALDMVNATSSNGGALYTITNQQLTDAYSGMGGLPAGCTWDLHAGASVKFVVFVQIFRPAASATCSL